MWVVLTIIAAVVLFEIVGLLMLRHDLTAYKNYWEKRAVSSDKDNSILYVALGDSASQSVGASQPQKGYVGLLADKLATDSGKNIHIVNLSVSGAKVIDVAKTQLPKLDSLAINADTIITIDIGSNDLKNFEPAEFKQKMDDLLSKLPKQTVVADIPYFGGGRLRARESNAAEASQIIKELTEKYGLKMAELHQITKTRDNLGVYAADLFHPNNRGYNNWNDAFAKALGL